MRKTLAAALSAIVLLAGAASAQPAVRAQDQPSNWTIDPNHTAATFNVVHLGLSHVEGHFTKVSGTGYWNGEDYQDARLDVTIDVSSVDTRVERRDADLKSPNFFDVAQYPTMVFKSRRLRKKGNGHVEVLGDLTIHGVTRPVLLDTVLTGPVKDPWGNTRIGAHATTSVNRKDFGLLWNHTLDNGTAVVSDNVDITLDAEIFQPLPK
ncbi:MAG TPA: YceI family protein [Candidatus Xenobia bacterium]|jgi:polyisoprenoid-binding protein YceI